MNTGLNQSRVVLVTGGSRGIGTAVVRSLAMRGVRVGCSYMSSLRAAEEIAEEYPETVIPVHYELGNAESARNSIATLVERWGRLDGVIANAGIWAGGRLDRMDEATWNRVLTENIQGVAQVSRAALPHMRGRLGSSITIMSSVIGLIGGPGDTAYATAKAGLFGLGRALSKEVARDGVRVNMLAPGFVETGMTANVSESSRQKISNSILLGRFGTSEEVAAAAVFLSEDATYCTGSILTVDGGWSI